MAFYLCYTTFEAFFRDDYVKFLRFFKPRVAILPILKYFSMKVYFPVKWELLQKL
ncbi:hypothetical protein LEP1GSC088_4029 [Leptospira interrogans str. L1207]|nr:hypothetical protein LEP1GSC088_4029 [Leptospira interrogans str. L1207]